MNPTAAIHNGLSWESYFAMPALSSTGARTILSKSPFHFRYRDAKEDMTKAMEVGRAVHMLVLEPALFAAQYRVYTKPKGVGMKAAMAEIENQALADGVELIEADDMAEVESMRQSLWSCATLRDYLGRANLEQSITWIDEETGCPCKARLDIRVEDQDGRCVIIDLKSCREAGPDAFSRAIHKYGYHIQAAFYMEAARAAGFDPKEFLFVAQEKPSASKLTLAPPPMIYRLDAGDVAIGLLRVREAMKIYMDCHRRNFWPCYQDGGPAVVDISLPAYAYTQDDEEVDYDGLS